MLRVDDDDIPKIVQRIEYLDEAEGYKVTFFDGSGCFLDEYFLNPSIPEEYARTAEAMLDVEVYAEKFFYEGRLTEW